MLVCMSILCYCIQKLLKVGEDVMCFRNILEGLLLSKPRCESHNSVIFLCLYRSLLDVLREAIESRQILSLYQGLGTKNLQSVVSQFIYFYSYSFFKQWYLQRASLKKMGTGANLIIAAAAGTCTVVLTQVQISTSHLRVD